MSEHPPYRFAGSTLFLNCYLQPGASKNTVVGRYGEALKIRLTAPPVDGKANAALLEFLSAYFSVPLSSLTLLSGHTARHKRVKIEGLTQLPAAFEALCLEESAEN